MNGHQIEQCIHGTIIKRCRCMGPHTVVVRIGCPDHCEFKDEEALVFEVEVKRNYTEKVFVVAPDKLAAESRARTNLHDQVVYTSSGWNPESVSPEVLATLSLPL